MIYQIAIHRKACFIDSKCVPQELNFQKLKFLTNYSETFFCELNKNVDECDFGMKGNEKLAKLVLAYILGY